MYYNSKSKILLLPDLTDKAAFEIHRYLHDFTNQFEFFYSKEIRRYHEKNLNRNITPTKPFGDPVDPF